jgi:hypothetical protein
MITVSAKSLKGHPFTATSQYDLRKPSGFVCGEWKEEYRTLTTGKGASTCWDPYTAAPGLSRHGNGKALDIEVTSPRTKAQRPPDSSLTNSFVWLALNGWKYGFVRTVTTECWHWEYWGDEARKKGPYFYFNENKMSDANFKRTLPLNGKLYDLANIKV